MPTGRSFRHPPRSLRRSRAPAAGPTKRRPTAPARRACRGWSGSTPLGRCARNRCWPAKRVVLTRRCSATLRGAGRRARRLGRGAGLRGRAALAAAGGTGDGRQTHGPPDRHARRRGRRRATGGKGAAAQPRSPGALLRHVADGTADAGPLGCRSTGLSSARVSDPAELATAGLRESGDLRSPDGSVGRPATAPRSGDRHGAPTCPSPHCRPPPVKQASPNSTSGR